MREYELARPGIGRILALAGMALVLVSSAMTTLANSAPVQPPSRAQSIEAPGTSNLYQVSDTLYRSAQPTAEGFRSLKDLGITTVVNLRSYHSDRDEIGTTGLATDPRRTPVLVHCQRRSDRTGAMVAAYRIAVQGWSKEAAVQEMTSENFGFHKVWTNLPDWINELDVEAIRKEASIGDDVVEVLTRQADLWDKAIVRKDRAAIEANMDDDFRQIDGAGNVETKATFVEGILSPSLVIDPYTVEDFEVRLYGDVALLSGRTKMTGRYDGKPFTSHYRYIDVYVRRDGTWKIVSVQISRITSQARVAEFDKNAVRLHVLSQCARQGTTFALPDFPV